MNDDQHDPVNEDPDDSAAPIADGSNPNGVRQPERVARPAATGVRSGLAHRRNPVLVALGDFSAGAGRLLFKDLLNTSLLLAAICLALAFALLLGSIAPSSTGAQVPLSEVESLVQHRDILSATLLDHDSRVEITTRSSETAPSQKVWTAYPSSGALTTSLLSELRKAKAIVNMAQQSGKPLRAIVVQFLIPTLLLVTLFALLTRIH